MSSFLILLVTLVWLILSTMVTLASAMFKDYSSVVVGSILSVLTFACLVGTVAHW